MKINILYLLLVNHQWWCISCWVWSINNVACGWNPPWNVPLCNQQSRQRGFCSKGSTLAIKAVRVRWVTPAQGPPSVRIPATDTKQQQWNFFTSPYSSWVSCACSSVRWTTPSPIKLGDSCNRQQEGISSPRLIHAEQALCNCIQFWHHSCVQGSFWSSQRRKMTFENKRNVWAWLKPVLSVSTCKAVPALRINQVDIIINAFVYDI